MIDRLLFAILIVFVGFVVIGGLTLHAQATQPPPTTQAPSAVLAPTPIDMQMVRKVMDQKNQMLDATLLEVERLTTRVQVLEEMVKSLKAEATKSGQSSGQKPEEKKP